MTLTAVLTLNAILDALVVVGLLALVARVVRPEHERVEARVRPLPQRRPGRVAA